MIVATASQQRALILELGTGADLRAELARLLQAAGARAAFVQGNGTLKRAELATGPTGEGLQRRFDAGCELVSLSGTAVAVEGKLVLKLRACVAFDAAGGQAIATGELVTAHAGELSIFVTVLDEPESASTRAAAPRAVTAETAAPAPRRSIGEVVAAPAPAASSWLVGGEATTTAMPQRPPRKPEAEEEPIPEPGDRATHFHFGECTVVSSDGDRIRLKQDRDGRMREVALSMLRVEAATVDPETGQKHFQILRKQ